VPGGITQRRIDGLSTSRYVAQVQACDLDGCSAFSSPLQTQVGTFRLTVFRVGGGSVSSNPQAIDCSPWSIQCLSELGPDTVVSLAATEGSDPQGTYWEFDHWEGACSGYQLGCTITMNQTRNVTAVFRPTYTEPPCEFC
jgi:hypothetical protein